MTQERPIPQRDVSGLQESVTRHGFGMYLDAVDGETTEAIRERVLEQAATERRANLHSTNTAVEPEDDVNQWVAFLPNKGRIFRRLIDNRPCLDIVRFILGRDAILSEFSAHITWPGNREMPLHIDQWFMPHPVRPDEDYPRPSDITRGRQRCGEPVPATGLVNPPVVCNVMFAITDFTWINGATRLVPGSHRSGCHPDPEGHYATVQAEVPAGSFVVWEGRTWHAASLNTGDGPRIGITTYWSAPFLRQLLNFTYGLRPEVAADLTDQERSLMGFRTWSTYGTSDNFESEWARPGRDNTGPLSR